MDVREHCDNLALQLSVWKEELFEVAVTAENFHSLSREVIGPEFRELMKLIDAIGIKIDEFKKTCPDNRAAAEAAKALR